VKIFPAFFSRARRDLLFFSEITSHRLQDNSWQEIREIWMNICGNGNRAGKQKHQNIKEKVPQIE
jgi:hypothetical protein